MSDVPAPAPSPGGAPPSGGGQPPSLEAVELAAVTAGRLVRRSDRPVRGAAVDSRLVQPGQLFVALPGERTDGHRFLDAAVERGAAALLVSRDLPGDAIDALGDVTIIRVPDALPALHAIAAAWRSRFDPLVVGVTGSIAKTSTKEAIATVLGAAMPTLRNEGNQNNEIGLPLTVLRLGPEHRAAVLEMGMYVGGEIAGLARIARPEIGVVTAVQPVHLSRIGTIEAVEQAKGELVEALPADGVAVLNVDDERVRRMAGRTRARAISYGFAPDADVGAEAIESRGLDGMAFELVAAGVRNRVAIPGMGRLAVHNALAAAAVGREAGLPHDAIARGLAAGWSAPHRSEVHRFGGITVVDDAYNASPASVLAALDLLAGLPGRHVAVLGEMLELGAAAEDGHLAVGRAAAAAADLLVVVGAGASGIADGARSAGLEPGRLVVVPDRVAAAAELAGRLVDGDVVLLKASRSVELDLLLDDLESAFGQGGRATSR